MIRTLATLVLLAAALALHLQGLRPHFAYEGYNFDAVHVYLPFAQKLLAQGPSFLLTEPSIEAPPVSYIWPALLGAELSTVKIANVALSCVLLLLVFRTATLWHSRLAGLLSAFAFAASPLLKPFLPTAVTEPPFLFLVGVWIWALSEWRIRDRPAYLPIAAIALGLALLTRASLFYGLVALVVILAVRRERVALYAHLGALAIPLVFIIKNFVVFHFPFYTTGAGNALYLGTSPLFGGYDPWYVNLIYDVGAVTGSQSHLSLEAESLLGRAARILLTTLDPGFIAAMYAKKLAAFLFITNAETSGNVLWLRSFRIATLILSFVGLLAIRDRMLRWIVAGVIAYQVAAHIPVLYAHRYSVGALDVWLATLSGVGLAALWQRRRATEWAGTAIALLVGIMAGAHALWHGGMPEPNALAAENVLVWEARDQALKFDRKSATLELDVRDAPNFSPWFNHVLLIDSTLTRGGSDEACGEIRLAYRRQDAPDFSAPLVRNLVADGRRHVDQFGAEVPMRLGTEGRLRIEASCGTGGSLNVHRIAVYSARGAAALRQKILSSR